MNKNKFQNIFIIFLVLFEFTVYMANDLIMPGMLHVVSEFKSDDTTIPLSLSLYLLGGMLLQVLIGPISDQVGRRKTMIFGCLFFALCTGVIILSSSMPGFLIARFFQGMGLCFITVCGYATVQEMFEEKQAVRVVALMTTTSVSAPILGPILGGLVVESFNWRWIFVFTLVCTLISFWGIWKTMPETVKRKEKGKAKSSKKWNLVSLFKPILVSYQKALSNPGLVLGGCLNGLLSAPILCWIAISPIVLFENAKVPPESYGLIQVPIFGLFILGNYILRKFTYKHSLKKIIQMGFPICFIALAIQSAFSYVYPNSYWSLVIPLSFYCLGDGIISAPITRLSLFATQGGKGIASAVHGLISSIVTITSVSLMPVLFFGKNLNFSLFCLGCVVIFAAVLGVFLMKLPRSASAQSIGNLEPAAQTSN